MTTGGLQRESLLPPSPAAGNEEKTVSLPLELIRIDGGTQSRSALDASTVQHYAEEMAGGAKFPLIIVYEGPDDREPTDAASKSKHYWLASGFHRYHAMLQRGVVSEFVRVRSGGRREAILFSVGANHQHGLQRSRADKRFAVRLLLSDPEWWNKSLHWIAEKCHVSDDLAASVKDEMIAETQLQSDGNNFDPVSLSETDSEDEGEALTEARVRGGKMRRIKAGRINRHRLMKVKPVEIETETSQIAKKMSQIVRSIPKAIRQAKALGWDETKFLDECRAVWAQIPLLEV